MTSRVSYFKMTVNEMKRRSWYGAAAFLGFFCAFPLMTMLRFQSVGDIARNVQDVAERENAIIAMKQDFLSYVGGGDVVLMFLIPFIALLGAWSGLSWLHSKKKMDLMGSLPVRREKLFITESLATLLLAMIPYVCNLILALLVAGAKGIFTGRAAAISLAGLGIHLVYFMVFYFCGTLAMILTGKILTGILGTGVFLVIVPLICGVVETYASTFWKAYTSANGAFWRPLAIWMSPAGNLVKMTQTMELYWDKGSIIASFPWMTLAAAVLMAMVFAGFSFWLLKIRRAESAEKAMAFSKTEGVIKSILLYPLILGGGLFFLFLGSANGTEQKFWLWFGIVFTALLGSILIEIIYYFDKKKIFAHKLWTGISMGAAILTAAVFVFDLLGYDHWLPKEDQVERAVICSDSLWWTYPDGSRTTKEYLETNMESIQGKAILELAREGVENLDRTEWDDSSYSSVDVYFRMKNGKIKERSYMVSDKTLRETERQLYQEEAYKQAVLPVLLLEAEDIHVEEIRRFEEYLSLDFLSTKEKTEFVKLYQEDLKALDYDEIYADNSSFMVLYDEAYHYTENYPLNENFEKSTAYLKSKGLDAVSPLDADKVRSIRLVDSRTVGETEPEMEEDVAETVEGKTIQDPELIRKALENPEDLVYTGCSYENKTDMEKLCTDLLVDITYEMENGDLISSSWAYVDGKIPQAIEEFLKNRG